MEQKWAQIGFSPPFDRRTRSVLARTGRAIDWQQPFGKVLDYSRPPFARWFVGGETNLCHNAVDRHLEDRGDQKALIYISTETGQEQDLYLPRTARRGQPLRRGDAGRRASARATAC